MMCSFDDNCLGRGCFQFILGGFPDKAFHPHLIYLSCDVSFPSLFCAIWEYALCLQKSFVLLLTGDVSSCSPTGTASPKTSETITSSWAIGGLTYSTFSPIDTLYLIGAGASLATLACLKVSWLRISESFSKAFWNSVFWWQIRQLSQHMCLSKQEKFLSQKRLFALNLFVLILLPSLCHHHYHQQSPNLIHLTLLPVLTLGASNY